MKKVILFAAVMVIVVVGILFWLRISNSNKSAALSPANTIVRIYFTGAANLAADTNSPGFTNIFCCSQARALESQTLDKLARAPRTWFKNKLSPGTPDGSAQLRPLLDDFLTSKWVFQMCDATSSPEYALAIQLNDNRAQLWETNLRTLLESWTGIQATNISGGWQLKKDMPPNLFRIVRATNNWLIVGCGQDELPLSDAWTSAGPTAPKPGEGGPLETNDTSWVSAKINWPRLAEIFPVFAKFDLPKMQMQVVGRNGLLLPSGTFELSQPLPALPDWQLPTDLIRQPLTSFTAIRGFAPWLENQPWANWFPLSPEPDQAFIWSLGSSPFQSYVAVPVTNSVTALARLGEKLSTDTNWQNHLTMRFALGRTNNHVFLRNVPFMTPEVWALNEPSGDFLLADLFANPPFGKAPQGLFEEVNRQDLVFYHWEITPNRLKELPEPTQLGLLLTKHRQLDASSAAGQWLNRIGPTLGSSATEVRLVNPSELAFRRSARAGLTAIELMALTEWLEAPNFPGCDLSLPPPVVPMHHPQMKMRHLQNTNQPSQHLLSTNKPPQHPQNSNQPPATIKK
jgi:hypothetical protein